MYYVEQSASFECIAETGLTGLVGTIELQIVDNLGAVVDGPSALSIIEHPAGSGVYQATRTAPALVGQYALVWSTDGSFAEDTTIADDLTVVLAGAGDALPPITPIGPGPGARVGPCNAWTTEDDVAACCSAEVGTDFSVFSDVVDAASQVLWELSGRQFAGTCDRTFRPCQTSDTCGMQILSRGHIVGWDGMYWNGAPCGCQHLSEVKLSGYPLREIVEVKIDGVVLDPAEYRLDGWRKLVRLNGNRWPSCQRLDLEDTEVGTWSVRYTYGQNPPWIGQMAARELACDLYKACNAEACAVPKNATRITRQGISIDRGAFVSWAYVNGTWKTGLPLVDQFLGSYNRSGLRRRPVAWAPSSTRRYARSVGD